MADVLINNKHSLRSIARLKQMREEDSIESAEAFTVTPAPERNATKDILDVYRYVAFRH